MGDRNLPNPGVSKLQRAPLSGCRFLQQQAEHWNRPDITQVTVPAGGGTHQYQDHHHHRRVNNHHSQHHDPYPHLRADRHRHTL